MHLYPRVKQGMEVDLNDYLVIKIIGLKELLKKRRVVQNVHRYIFAMVLCVR